MNKTKFFGHHLIELNSVDSTNNYATNLLKNGICEDATVIMADYQTKGRGRRDKNWQSKEKMNLTFSLVRKFKNFKIEDQFLLTQIASLAILDCLKDYNVQAFIKWPNDILVEQKKISGILIENSISNNGIDSVIIGIGLNIDQRDFKEINATSLANQGINIENKKEVLKKILENLNVGFHQILMRNKQWIEKEYFRYLFGKETFENYYLSGSSIHAKVKNISPNGNLILENEEGKEIAITSWNELEWIHRI